ncbi:hypothetical protein [Pedobacter sp. SYP-B3415]|uniref:hypothetical protein n=1 Tax=Pedobacter sp. SYP-B3415 TaxID=2496641 RepID=UPI00101DDAA5|nr:hypothetical protein [Pedobacter sp. SYP-B3415]
MTTFDHILLFKTDLSSRSAVDLIRPVLDSLEHIEQWNVDLWDEDFVLRVVSYKATHDEIITLLNRAGHACAELK